MTTGDSNDKIKSILDDARKHTPTNVENTINTALMAMAVIELKRIADCMEAAQESGPR